MHPPSPRAIEVLDLGRIPYDEALSQQRQSLEHVAHGRSTGTGGMRIFLVEHDPPVITISRRPTARNHLLATPAQLQTSGVTVAETDRGGDITYHGPGQLVVYPILDLNVFNLRLHGYMRLLEDVVIDSLAPLGITGRRDPTATGVWVNDRKICAIGVRVSRWVSMHGLALNVTTNLDHFNLIVPCGLAGRGVTSLQLELGDRTPDMSSVKQLVVRAMLNRLYQCLALQHNSSPPPAPSALSPADSA